MRASMKFRMNVVALGVLAALGSGQAMAVNALGTGGNTADTLTSTGAVLIQGNDVGSNTPTVGVTVSSNGAGALGANQAYVTVNSSGDAVVQGTNSAQLSSGTNYFKSFATTGNVINGDTGINGSVVNINTTNAGAVTIGTTGNGQSTTILGVTNINTTGGHSTSIGNFSGNFSAVTIQGDDGVSINNNVAGTTNIGNGAASTTNIGAWSGASSINVGNSASTVTLLGATTINTTGNATTVIGSATSATTIGGTLSVGGAVNMTNNKINNLANGTASTDAVNLGQLNAAIAGVSGGGSVSGGASVLGGTTSAGTAVVNSGGTGATVDANGKITTAAVSQTTASMTVTNGAGNTHGYMVNETQATMSGGIHSTSLTLNDSGARFSNSATGAPVTVTGVADGKQDFDAVNFRQMKQVAAGVAGVSAIANIPQVDQNKTFAIGVGLGGFQSQTALALGGSYRVAQNAVIKASVSTSSESKSTVYGVGAGMSW